MTAALKLERPARTVTTRLFGELCIDADQVMDFDAGLPGFPDMRQFMVLPTQAPGFAWLQCLDDPALALLMVDYDSATGGALDAGRNSWAIVTLPRRGQTATANLRAPVLVDYDTQSGRQVILADSALSTAEPIDLDALADA
jgi:flagellar assembly factor FliW